MKQEFVNFVNALMEAAPEVTEKLMTKEIKSYLEVLSTTNDEKPMFTDNGKVIINFMKQEVDNNTMWTAKKIAEELGIASRSVAGSMRKLCSDGFVDKVGKEPSIYTLTEKGKEIIIDD